ncbi:hypothetical protein PARPLA_02994 [Rhodobacteraceae bacterium THAF1]|uniref:hypothetical protein n=1 Tax=Palleronia sp. THAF1 TaxID=2587842 RepID=UPI000F3CA16A|nr:hypothetical protein [Palleronia sp. THAF1]QFU08395.1 hypothetical protein FIU81_06880 [Palleronia sp. THAF1]VDC29156.1 hypothetical protein PARPLA_02994 [Rhodobacteraceae bacterium THAF1]
MSRWRDNRWTGEPDTRKAAWWAIGTSTFAIVLFGWLLMDIAFGTTEIPVWVSPVFLISIVAIIAFVVAALKRFRIP